MTNGQKVLLTIVAVLSLGGLGYGAYLWFGKGKSGTKDSGTKPPSSTGGGSAQPVRSTSTTSSSIQPSSGFPLQLGSTGDNVVKLQQVMKKFGQNLGSGGANKDGVDGNFGSLTQAAVKSVMGWTGGIVQKSDLDYAAAQNQLPLIAPAQPDNSQPKTAWNLL